MHRQERCWDGSIFWELHLVTVGCKHGWVVRVLGQLATLCKPQRWPFEDSELHFHTLPIITAHLSCIFKKQNIGPLTFKSSCEPKHLCMCISNSAIKEGTSFEMLFVCRQKASLCVRTRGSGWPAEIPDCQRAADHEAAGQEKEGTP